MEVNLSSWHVTQDKVKVHLVSEGAVQRNHEVRSQLPQNPLFNDRIVDFVHFLQKGLLHDLNREEFRFVCPQIRQNNFPIATFANALLFSFLFDGHHQINTIQLNWESTWESPPWMSVTLIMLYLSMPERCSM